MSPRGGAIASPGGGNRRMFREAWDCHLARNDRIEGGGGKRKTESFSKHANLRCYRPKLEKVCHRELASFWPFHHPVFDHLQWGQKQQGVDVL